MLSNIHEKQKKYNKAIAVLDNELQDDFKKDYDYLYHKASIYEEMKNYDHVLNIYNMLLNKIILLKLPIDNKLVANIIRVYSENEKIEKAIVIIKQFVLEKKVIENYIINKTDKKNMDMRYLISQTAYVFILINKYYG